MRIFSDREVLYHVSKLHSDYMSGASLSRAPLQIFLRLDFVGLHDNDICHWHFQQSSLMQHVLTFYHLVVEFLERKIMSTKCAHEYECSKIVSELDLSFCQIFEL
jgi:hypothetical protein